MNSPVSSSSRLSPYYNQSLHLPDNDNANIKYGGGAMLPIFLRDLAAPSSHDAGGGHEPIQINFSVYTTNPAAAPTSLVDSNGERLSTGLSSWSREKFIRLPKSSLMILSESQALSEKKMTEKREQLQMTHSKALNGLQFINQTTREVTEDVAELWKHVEIRFNRIAKNGYIAREDFGECIGMMDSKEFAVGIFDTLARRKRQKIKMINKQELHDFWLQLCDNNFDARLQIFFDMVDSNEDGRITKDEVQELIMLSASANKLSSLEERSHEYANLIMEELDPDNHGYIELWQLKAILLQRDVYLEHSSQLSTKSGGLNQNYTQSWSLVKRATCSLNCLILENWKRTWIILLWLMVMATLFTWKFLRYRKTPAFQVMGYCLCSAKGAAETLKLNMALILLPVSRNTLTWLRSTRARLFVPFDDNINFHKIIACAIVIGIILHAGNHLACNFPLLINSSPDKFALIATNFNNKNPTYWGLITSIEGLTGFVMVILMAISFTLATSRFRRNVVRLPEPFHRLAGYNAFWYSHHLLGLVYIILVVHGFFLFQAKKWTQKTTWMYLCIPIMIYIAERCLRTFRSEICSAKVLKVSDLPGHVFHLIMSKPKGFKYKSGQYIFLQCPSISKFEWHPFSITSAPEDNYLSVHIRIVGDWTHELKRVLIEGNAPVSAIGRLKFAEEGNIFQRRLPRLQVDGPYGAPAQDYQNYDVLLLVGLGIGATPFISILKDLSNNAKATTDSNTDLSISDESLSSFASQNIVRSGKRRATRVKKAYFYWVTREQGSFEWFKGVMDEVAETDHKGLINMHNYLTSVYEEGDARSTLLSMVQALTYAKYGIDILSGTSVKTHFGRPDWKQVFVKVAQKHPQSTIGVFYCGRPLLANELKKLSHEMSRETGTLFDFHKEQF